MSVFVALLLLFSAVSARAQNHPELDWEVVETEHFLIYYHQGLEGAAVRAADIAEDAYQPITQLYSYAPDDKVRIILKDFDDYANGAAYYFQDAIEIWGTALEHDFDLRGTTDWLRNVITHEFTHIISLGAARKTSQRVPALYLQYFGYQREDNRPDVLVGYPDVLVSYPVMTTVVPMWFAEGVAQYQAEGARHDRWDSHRDMILRTAVLDGKALSFDHMGVFGKKGFGNEYVYDHGYGLVRHIGQTHGDEKLAEIARAASSWSALTIEGAIEQSLGMTTEQLYAEWQTTLGQRYEAQVVALGTLAEGETVVDVGFSNLYPSLSPDGQRLAYLSTQEQHYGPHRLVVRQVESGEEEVVAAGVSPSTLSWSPDGRRLLFVRKDRADKYGSRQADIYAYDFDGEDSGLLSDILWAVPYTVGGFAPKSPRIERLSKGLRALYPSWSPDGKWIAFVHNAGTSNNLGLLEVESGKVHYLTDFADGTQLYTPSWSPDGSYLVVSMARQAQRDIVLLRVLSEDDRRLAAAVPMMPAQRQLEALVATPGTDRDPVWSSDGREVVFASDVSGIFNLYAINVETRQVRQLTNLVGGAFNPTSGSDGTVFFTAYDDQGYEIRRVGGEQVAAATKWDVERSRTYAAVQAAPQSSLVARPYGIDFLKTSVLPRLMVDEGDFKVGLYLGANDVLSKQNIFGGVALAPSNGERDIFAIYEIKKWRPTVFIEFFHQKRHSGRQDSTAARDLVITGMNFSLNQFNLGARGRLGRHSEVSVSATYDRYDASLQSRFFDAQNVIWRQQKPFGYTYLNGFDLGLTYRYKNIARRRDRDINPRGGRNIYFRYDRMFNYFIEGFDQNNTSFLDEQYLGLFYNQFTLDWQEHIGLPANTTLGLRFYGGWIASDAVDDDELVNDFFDYHLGGLQYMKGYTFYSIEGRKASMVNATWRFPILPDMRKRFSYLYFDKVYGALYGDVGKAWDEKFDDPDPIFQRQGLLRDVGGQLRFDLISYYTVPTRVQLDLAYGIDEIKGTSPWKFYMTVLFGYL